MDNVDAVVIGAGVIGLAVARALALRGREVIILEAEDHFGTVTSSRNSEVIHAGIYYPRGSLKARTCVTGRGLLYDFCEQYGVPYRRCGKLIVATSEAQLAELDKINEAAAGNGVELEFFSRAQALELEPQLICDGALYSPLTGIIDSHSYMLALLGQAEDRGATLVTGNRVTQLRLERGGILVGINGEEPALFAQTLINSAGIFAPDVARLIHGFPAEHIPQRYFGQGKLLCAGRDCSPFERLVYPIPEPGAWECTSHSTWPVERVSGRMYSGWRSMSIRSSRGVPRSSMPRSAPTGPTSLTARCSRPMRESGLKSVARTSLRPDFRIDGPETHGVAVRVVNLFGIESPGLTASPRPGGAHCGPGGGPKSATGRKAHARPNL